MFNNYKVARNMNCEKQYGQTFCAILIFLRSLICRQFKVQSSGLQAYYHNDTGLTLISIMSNNLTLFNLKF